ncbi:Uncharacterised protein [Bordetella pertussis]|nr:Uncharacterised protein [Bordetella pertussis]
MSCPAPPSCTSTPPLQGRTAVAGARSHTGTPAAATLAAILAATCCPVTSGSTAIQSSVNGLSLPRPPRRSPASTSKGANPRRASQIAQDAPAGPPPTITAS